MKIKHAILFAGAILLTAALLRGTEEEGIFVITTVLVPLWFLTSQMLERREKGVKSDNCIHYD